MTKPITDDDCAMVADRLGLEPGDVWHVREALEDVQRLGYDGFVDQTYREVETAVQALRRDQPATRPVVRRALTRKAIAVGLTQMLDLKAKLAQYEGPAH